MPHLLKHALCLICLLIIYCFVFFKNKIFVYFMLKLEKNWEIQAHIYGLLF
jgi:hypothetical protein